MHIPDGFIDAPVSAAAGIIAVGGLAICLRGARQTLSDRMAPLVGLVAVFIFAAQMFNFPVGAGTSGHLMGAALAAILVGPYAGALAVSAVLIVQALLFADGGLTALGLNILNIALIGTIVAWPTFRLLIRWAGRGKPAVFVVSLIAALLSVVAASLGFVAEYALGGTAVVDLSAVTVGMVSVHILIGLVEGVITALVVTAIMSVRPDLVAGLQSPSNANEPELVNA